MAEATCRDKLAAAIPCRNGKRKMIMKKRICFQAVATLVFSLNVCAADTGNMFSSPVAPVGPAKTAGQTISQKTAILPGENTMKLIIRTGNDRLDGHTFPTKRLQTRDFISLLPVTVTLEDFNKTGKNRHVARKTVHCRPASPVIPLPKET